MQRSCFALYDERETRLAALFPMGGPLHGGTRLLLGSGSTAYTERADSARGPQVVLVPIVLGMLANAKFPGVVKKIVPFSPVHTMLDA